MKKMSIYQQYVKGLIEVEDMTQEQFNNFMLEHYAGYKSRGGTMNFKEFIKFCDEVGF
jgi:hypothetical protein